MQVHLEPAQLQEMPESPAGCAAVPELVYDLRRVGGCSDGFYEDVARFSDRLLAEIEGRAGDLLDGYTRYVQEFLREAGRSRGEYAIELLTLGVSLRQYGGAAESTPGRVIVLARELFWLRRRSAIMKPPADLLRAAITRRFLLPKIGRKTTSRWNALDGLPRLIEWLQAAGEFEQEAVRLNNWRSFLSTLPRAGAERCIETVTELFDWFQCEAERALGAYTRGVSGFLAGEYARRGCREDQTFCGKEPAEYHLSMVATEIMNRGLRPEFERTPQRVVLVPACMRGAHARNCQARESGIDIACSACNPDCAVNRITRRMRSLGAKVYLVPHSTGFSRWLERWQRAPEVGVIAVACMLNILPGGYEMRARGIASQCVPLDYPGCRKHWRREGIATGVNEERLVRIVAGSQP
jgi:hypothetical protein